MRRLRLKHPSLISILVLGILLGLGFGWLLPKVAGFYYQLAGGKLLVKAMMASSSYPPCNFSESDNPKLAEQIMEAVPYLRAAYRLDPWNTYTLLLLGRASCYLEKPEQAINYYISYTLRRPSNPIGYLELGYAYDKLGKVDLAVDAWTTAGFDAGKMLEVCSEARNAKMFSETAECYQRANSLDPGSVNLWYYLGLDEEEQGNWAKALENYMLALQEGKTNLTGISDIYYRLGFTHIRLFDSNQAVSSFDRAIKLGDFSSRITKADALFQRSALLEGQGIPASEHISVLEETVRLNPHHAEAHAMLGTAYYLATHNLSAAVDEISTALAINPLSKWSYIRLAQIYFEEQDFASCSQVINSLINLFPEDPEVQATLNNLQGCVNK